MTVLHANDFVSYLMLAFLPVTLLFVKKEWPKQYLSANTKYYFPFKHECPLNRDDPLTPGRETEAEEPLNYSNLHSQVLALIPSVSAKKTFREELSDVWTGDTKETAPSVLTGYE